MANFAFTRLDETETRKPSKIRLVLCILVVLLLALSATFIVLYLKEKLRSTDSTKSQETCTSSSCLTAAGMQAFL